MENNYRHTNTTVSLINYHEVDRLKVHKNLSSIAI